MFTLRDVKTSTVFSAPTGRDSTKAGQGQSYQYLVQRSAGVLAEQPTEPFSQEPQNESCHLCTSLHSVPSLDPDYRPQEYSQSQQWQWEEVGLHPAITLAWKKVEQQL